MAGPNGSFFKALIFDLYGTLVEIFKLSEYQTNLNAITTTLGLDPERFSDCWKDSWDVYPYGDYPSVKARFEYALAKYHSKSVYPKPKGLEKAIKLRLEYIRRQNSLIKEGVFDALDWAKAQGYKLGMVSNCSTETALYWHENPLSKYIPAPTLSCIVKLKKPQPEIFLKETNKLGVDPSRCIYIADGDDHEFTTAKALGMTTILVKYDTSDAYRHQPFPENEHVIYHFKELPGLVDRIELAKRGTKL